MKNQVKSATDPKDKDFKSEERNDKRRKRKAKKDNDIEKEEMNVLRSVVAATQEPAKRDDFDLFGEYVATKMRKLSQKLDEDAIEIIEYEITTILMKPRSKTGPIQTFKHIIKWKLLRHKVVLHLL